MNTNLHIYTYLKLDSHMRVNMKYDTFLAPCTFMSEISEVDSTHFNDCGEPQIGQDSSHIKA